MKALWVLPVLLGLPVLLFGGWYAYLRSVETPAYAVVASERSFELRDYPKMIAAEVRRTGGRQTAVSLGFGPLAGYIFAKERSGERIAMTAPVTQEPIDESGGAWAVRFILPARYSMETLPPPASADVRLTEIPSRRVGAVRFSGRATDADFAARQSALEAWLARQDLHPAGAATFAYYDDPSIPGFLRRNEVLIPVREGSP
ncbi:MAG: heme-binding protein [Myxococcota bacterium]